MLRAGFALGDEVRWTLVRGDHEWLSRVLGTTYPGSTLDVDVEVLDLDGAGGTAGGWVVLRRGRLAINVGPTQEVARPTGEGAAKRFGCLPRSIMPIGLRACWRR